jgi:hypothetical protein
MAKNKTVNIPESWSEVKYKDYYRFIKSIEGQEEDNELVVEMCLLYLCNLNTQDYYNLPKKSFEQVTETVIKLLMDQGRQPLVTSFTSFGQEYRIEPDMENMSYGMYLDLTAYSKDIWRNLPILCSILYRPLEANLGAMYSIKPYQGTTDDTIEMFEELLTMDICHGVVGFFLTLQQDLLSHSLTSIAKDLKKDLTSQQLEVLQRNGVDIKQLLLSLEETLPNLIK